MLKHSHGIPNPKRVELLQIAAKRLQDDGLSSLNLKVVGVKLYPLFTHIQVDVGEPPAPPTTTTTTTASSATTTTATALENSSQSLSPKDKNLLIKIISNFTQSRNFSSNELASLKSLFLNLEKLR